MNHGEEGSWKSWLPMLLCCAAMIGFFVLLGLGVWSIR